MNKSSSFATTCVFFFLKRRKSLNSKQNIEKKKVHGTEKLLHPTMNV